MEIGVRLKEARMEEGLTLDDVQETTKIQKRYLIAIEEGNYNILPGSFYARAFIKEYAAAVGLDANELLEEYKDEIPQTDEESTVQYTRIQRSRKENNPSKNPAIFSFLPTVIVVLLVIGIFFAAWFFYQKTLSDDSTKPVEEPEDNVIINEPTDVEQNDQSAAEDETKNDAANEDGAANDGKAEANQDDKTSDTPEPKLTVVEKGSGTSPVSTLALENADDTVKITFKSDGKSYLQVKNGEGKTFYAGPMTADSSPKEIDVSDEERVYLNIGNAPDLQISINDVELTYPVNPDDEVHQKLWINLASAGE